MQQEGTGETEDFYSGGLKIQTSPASTAQKSTNPAQERIEDPPFPSASHGGIPPAPPRQALQTWESPSLACQPLYFFTAPLSLTPPPSPSTSALSLSFSLSLSLCELQLL